MTNLINRIFSRFSIHVGLLIVIGLAVITAGILVCVLPPEKQNSDLAKGFLTLVTGIVTGCFALIQSHQQASSPESRQRLDTIQQQIEQLSKSASIPTHKPDSATDHPAHRSAMGDREDSPESKNTENNRPTLQAPDSPASRTLHKTF